MLTGLGLSSSYPTDVLPALLVFGAGLGLVFSAAMSNATAGIDHADAGVASAMVNVGQQVGGSIGTALLNTIAATAASNYVSSHAPSPQLPALAAMHSYNVAFLTSGAILLGGALLAGVVMRPKPTTGHGGETVAL